MTTQEVHTARTSILQTVATFVAIFLWAAQAGGSSTWSDSLNEARRIAQINQNWTVLTADGDSMIPIFNPGEILVVNRCLPSQLQIGMVAVYRDFEGDLVAHRVIRATGDNVVAKGWQNRNADPHAITPEALIGTVVAVLSPNAAPTVAELSSPGAPAIALGKRY